MINHIASAKAALPMPSFFQSMPHPKVAQARHGATWVDRFNTDDGYEIGQTNFERDEVTILATTKNRDAFYVSDLVRLPSGSHWACGWESRQDIKMAPSHGKPVVDRSPCMAQLARLSYRSSIGGEFNEGVHASDDGSFTYQVSQQCTGDMWRNNAAEDAVSAGVSITVARRMPHPLYDFEGVTSLTPTDLHGRFVSIDEHALVIRSNQIGWGNLSKKSCYTGPPKGGPPNTEGLEMIQPLVAPI
jgi:hypothetical protein